MRLMYQALIGLFSVFVLFVVGLVVFDGDLKIEYLLNLFTELIGVVLSVAITITVINHLAEQRERDRLKQQLFRDLGGSNNAFATRAVRELRANGWLTDGSLKGIDLRKANLAGADLEDAIMDGVNLDEADLTGTDLKKVSLVGASLANTLIVGADLSYADLSNANLWKADFSKADLVRAKLLRSNLTKANLSSATLGDAILDFSDCREANFHGAQLERTSMYRTHMHNADFEYANLFNCNLERADLEMVSMLNTNLSACNLKDAKVRGVLCNENTMLPNSVRWQQGDSLGTFT